MEDILHSPSPFPFFPHPSPSSGRFLRRMVSGLRALQQPNSNAAVLCECELAVLLSSSSSVYLFVLVASSLPTKQPGWLALLAINPALARLLECALSQLPRTQPLRCRHLLQLGIRGRNHR
eukprot:scaffold4652_cov122-Isochrysis_galbana.AAC.3